MTAAALLAEAARTLAAAGVDAPGVGRRAPAPPRPGLGPGVAARPPRSRRPRARGGTLSRARPEARVAASPCSTSSGPRPSGSTTSSSPPPSSSPGPRRSCSWRWPSICVRDVEAPVIVDVGTGSGCIALSMAAEREDAEVHATDVSGPALQVARQNARRLGLDGTRDIPRRSTPRARGRARGAARREQPAVRGPFRARHARPGGPRPRAGTSRSSRRATRSRSTAGSCPAAARALRPGGALAVEISPALPEGVQAFFRQAGFLEPSVHEDLAGPAPRRPGPARVDSAHERRGAPAGAPRLVRPPAPRPSLAPHEGPLPRLGLGGDAPADDGEDRRSRTTRRS